jgi:hypothetical protein
MVSGLHYAVKTIVLFHDYWYLFDYYCYLIY